MWGGLAPVFRIRLLISAGVFLLFLAGFFEREIPHVSRTYRIRTPLLKGLERHRLLLMRWLEPIIIAIFVCTYFVILAIPDTGIIIYRAHVSQLKPYFK